MELGTGFIVIFLVWCGIDSFSNVNALVSGGQRGFALQCVQAEQPRVSRDRFSTRCTPPLPCGGGSFSRLSSRLYVVDADTVTAVGQQVSQSGADTLGVAVNTFFASVSSRLVGILIGNILAAAFVKYVTDFFKSGVANMGSNKDTNIKGNEKGIVREANQSNDVNTIPPEAFFKLALCVAIDLLGDSSFLIPGVGELEDLAWAPMSAYAMKFMFGSNALAGLDFVKEILPATDIVPLATVAWIFTYVTPKNPISDALGLRKAQESLPQAENSKDNDNVIDV